MRKIKEDLSVCPHADAWRFNSDTEPRPSGSRAGAEDHANEIAGTLVRADGERLFEIGQDDIERKLYRMAAVHGFLRGEAAVLVVFVRGRAAAAVRKVLDRKST